MHRFTCRQLRDGIENIINLLWSTSGQPMSAVLDTLSVFETHGNPTGNGEYGCIISSLCHKFLIFKGASQAVGRGS
jgi:non-ribosomal peptide synthetase component E (peptide arylation enzyme)